MPRLLRPAKRENGVLYLRCSKHPLPGLWIPAADFHVHARSTHGRRHVCRACLRRNPRRPVADRGEGRFGKSDRVREVR